ncbi:hypothetical protein KJ885_03070 [Patescibacteria group bacterium]|nr:hypothetical protein [Patescibacteria group bacterium]
MKKVIIFLILGILLLPLPSLAFNEDFIISDNELEDYTSMTALEIQQFLSDHGSFLAYYADFYPKDGRFMQASEIIWRTAQDFKINPKFILVMLEKEQSLITYKSPVDRRLFWAMGYGVCDNCLLSHPLVAQFRGFSKQVYFAADRIRNTYLADLAKYGTTHTGMGPGISKIVDGKYWVTPANNATSILYTYTPHIAGNKSFYLVWKRWFSNIKHPDGSLLQDAVSGGIYLIQNGAKRPFLSKGAFISRFADTQVIMVGVDELKKYPDGFPIKFPDYSLLRDVAGKIYMTVGDQIRPFESYDVFKSIGFSPFEIEDVTQADLDGYAIGSQITQASGYPTGALLQHKPSGGVFWVYDGIKYPIWDKAIISARFSKYSRILADDEELNKFERGAPVKFPDGMLIKSKNDPAVYFVSSGKLRPVPSEDVFLAYGWEWENIIWTTDKVLGLYELGAPITLNDNQVQMQISTN